MLNRKSESLSILANAGIVNPARTVKLIHDSINLLELDLTGLTVLTEAASGPYVVTPIIAALAGAKEVIAITRDSNYATADEVIRQTRALEFLCGIEGKTEIHNGRQIEVFNRPDIVTNLGFVRPLNQYAINLMKSGSVIALMCEAWELRESDIDLIACRERGVRVHGTNEEYPSLDVFAYSGWVAVQILLESGIEIHKSKIVVIGADKFVTTIVGLLKRVGVNAIACARLDASVSQDADAILVADYMRINHIIGDGGDMTVKELVNVNPTVTVVQFAGSLDFLGLQDAGIAVYPKKNLTSRRMMRTLAALGPKPVIELHSAGLKVGQIGLNNTQNIQQNSFAELIQKII